VRIEHNTSVNETVLYGMGDLHLRVMTERMGERYGVAVNTRPPFADPARAVRAR
jgi:elongation factor G